MNAHPGTIGRGGAAGVGVASVVSGIAGYAGIVVVARLLHPAAYAEFLTFWGSLFFCYGLLTGVQGDVTRSVTAARARTGAASGPRLVPLTIIVCIVASTLMVALAAWWGPVLFGDDWVNRVTVLFSGVVAFGGHAGVAGVLGGSGKWGRYALLVASEATMRLILVVVVATFAASLAGFTVAVAMASLTWIMFALLTSDVRRACASRSDRPMMATLAGWWHAALAAASSACLIVGYPVMLRATTSDAAFATAAPLLLAIMLTRGPILVPLGAYQNVAVAHFVGRAHDGLSPIRPMVPRTLAAAGALVAAGALLGPPALDLIRPGFHLSACMFAILTTSALLLGLITLSGALTLAFECHRAYAAGWVVATGVALLLLLVPASLGVRVGLSVIIGPVIGIGVHVLALRSASRAARASGTSRS